MTQLCWILAIALPAATAVVAPLTFSTVLEPGKSPVEVFTLRGRSVRCVTVWAVIAIASIGFAGLNGIVDCVKVVSGALLGFIPVCFWRVYFENYDFVEQFVKENKERMTYLLFDGMGVDENTFESVSSAVEAGLVEYWKKKLTKKWTEFSQAEIGELMFDSGIETAKLIVEKLGDDAGWTVLAFMQKWSAYVEHIRVPARIKEELEGCSVDRQIVNCIAIILANETREVREARGRQSGKVNFPYLPTVGLAAQKAVTEGILRWPRCLLGNADVRITSIDFDTTNLSLVSEGEMRQRAKEDIPRCVAYTLKELVEAGFLHLTRKGKANVSIALRNEKMMPGSKNWNASSFVEPTPLQKYHVRDDGELKSSILFSDKKSD